MIETTIDHVLAFLIPIFLIGAGGDQAAARHAALQLLDAHGATNAHDLLLSAEIIALSLTTLDSLGKSVADPEMSVNTRLRLRSNANALNRAADRNRKALAQVRKTAMQVPVAAPEADAAPPVPLPTAIQKVRDAIVQAAPSLAETLTKAGQPMSRQQRRFMMRKAEQARAAQERQARRAARLAQRSVSMVDAGVKDGAHRTDDSLSTPSA